MGAPLRIKARRHTSLAAVAARNVEGADHGTGRRRVERDANMRRRAVKSEQHLALFGRRKMSASRSAYDDAHAALLINEYAQGREADRGAAPHFGIKHFA